MDVRILLKGAQRLASIPNRHNLVPFGLGNCGQHAKRQRVVVGDQDTAQTCDPARGRLRLTGEERAAKYAPRSGPTLVRLGTMFESKGQKAREPRLDWRGAPWSNYFLS
ncbi:MAG TPA: hypothetical protein VJV21_00460 [Pyrinomonadaceae bacterium]|nr:hypothetical protein [Pyrinomonadaceae bacterium]